MGNDTEASIVRSMTATPFYYEPPGRTEVEARLRAALQQAGQPYEGPLRGDDFIRYGDKGGNRPYWLIVHWLSNNHLAAVFGDWRQGSRHEFKSWANGAAPSQREIAKLQRELEQRQHEREAAVVSRQAQAARLAADLWEHLPISDHHPYLEAKQVPALGLRVGHDEQGRGPCLVVPLRTLSGRLSSLQFIYPDGRKRFLPGGAKKGAFHLLGEIDPTGLLYLAEGYATAASLHLATHQPVVVAFDAGNLAAVVAALRRIYPDVRLVLAADNDQWKAAEIGPGGHPKGNTGVAKAMAVARQYGAALAVPDFTGLDTRDQPTDFNDLARLAGLEEVRRQVEQATDPALIKIGPYSVEEGCLTYWKETQHGVTAVRLGNFKARIAAEIVLDDGAEQRRRIELKGRLDNGTPLPPVTIPASQFAGMNWVLAQWGSAAVITAGQTIKDHIRCAIQWLSNGQVARRSVFEHTGWRRIDDAWVYLCQGGAIGATGWLPGYNVELPGPLQDYRLTLSTYPAAAIRASLHLLTVASLEIAAPLFLATYRALLGEALPVDFSLFLAGTTGTRKSEIAAIVQAHFGSAWHGRHLPAAWSSTSNSLERQAFLIKDAVLTVDDFCPGGNTLEIARFHREADRLLRAQGNRSGRARLNPDGGLRPVYHPRGLILATGEDLPRGQSLRGRMLVLEFAPDTIDLAVLSELQDYAVNGWLANSAGTFCHWLAPRLDELKTALPIRQRELRNQLAQGQTHARLPDIVASLVATAEVVAVFAADYGLDLGADWLSRLKTALLANGQAQAPLQATEDPASRFVQLIQAALASGWAHVLPLDGMPPGMNTDMTALGWQRRSYGAGEFRREEWIPQGSCIGRFKDDNLYLEPEAAYAMAQRLASEQTQPLPIALHTLIKALAYKGYLLSRNESRFTVQLRLPDGSRPRFLHLALPNVRTTYDITGDTGDSGDKETQVIDD
ncbi:MAG: toprim domain-containing protein [Candidatus Competibacteraceae bacterium]